MLEVNAGDETKLSARRRNAISAFDRAWLYRDSLRPVAEVTAGGIFTHFVYASNDAESGAPIALIRSGVLYRVVKDHLGSVRMVVNASTGAVAQRIDYDAYGKVLSETGAGFQPFGFAGGLHDATTKLVRFGARDYDASTGRWTNKDPIGFAGQQGNVYLYVNGEPVNGVDPTGEVAPLVVGCVIVGSAIVTAVAKYYSGGRKAEDAVLGAATGTLTGVSVVTGSGVLLVCGQALDVFLSTNGFKDMGGAADSAASFAGGALCDLTSGPAAPYFCPIAQEAAAKASSEWRKE